MFCLQQVSRHGKVVYSALPWTRATHGRRLSTSFDTARGEVSLRSQEERKEHLSSLVPLNPESKGRERRKQREGSREKGADTLIAVCPFNEAMAWD